MILIYIRGPEFQIIETGTTVRYHCSGTSVDNVSRENCEIFKYFKNTYSIKLKLINEINSIYFNKRFDK